MEHDIVRKYSDDRVKISGWFERIQQYPYDCPLSTVGQAAYRTFGYTTKHFIPRTTSQAMGDSVWGHFRQRHKQHLNRKETHGTEVNFFPYITSYRRDYFDPFPTFREVRYDRITMPPQYPTCKCNYGMRSSSFSFFRFDDD